MDRIRGIGRPKQLEVAALWGQSRVRGHDGSSDGSGKLWRDGEFGVILGEAAHELSFGFLRFSAPRSRPCWTRREATTKAAIPLLIGEGSGFLCHAMERAALQAGGRFVAAIKRLHSGVLAAIPLILFSGCLPDASAFAQAEQDASHVGGTDTSGKQHGDVTRIDATLEPPDVVAMRKQLADTQRKGDELWIKDLQSLLESKDRNLTDSEMYVVLWHLLRQFTFLNRKADPDAEKAMKQWKALLARHPEFVRHPPPLELRSQREARDREDRREAALEVKSQSFLPDDASATVFWAGRKLIAAY